MIPIGVDKPNMYEVINKLQTLGSAKQVAQFFEANRIKGRQNASSYCPVANYVRQQTGAGAVAVNCLSVAAMSFAGNGGFVLMEASSPVSRFIQTFDQGMYPQLVME